MKNLSDVSSIIKNYADGRFLKSLTETSTPDWLSAEQGSIIQLDDEYVTVPGNVGQTATAISTEIPFEAIDVPVHFTENADRIKLTVDFHTDEGSYQETVQADASTEQNLPNRIQTRVPTEEPVTEARLQLQSTYSLYRIDHLRQLLNRFTENEYVRNVPTIGIPTPRSVTDRPPVVLISVDSLRHDQRQNMEPLVDGLGDDAVVVDEPRTQGHWTPPSHASMLTGHHPAEHGHDTHSGIPITTEVQTLPELLQEAQYRCSAAVSHSRLLPPFGFGRGFDRFQLEQLQFDEWMSDERSDSATVVNTVNRWVTQDVTDRLTDVFYFIHVFDPHYPYAHPEVLLEETNMNLETVRRFREERQGSDYQTWQAMDEPPVSSEVIETCRRYYESSVRRTARHLRRFVEHLKTVGLFDDAFIVVTGDHGEGFFERGGFAFHESLYDQNIRPFMCVKPPADSDWDVPRRVDTIDILPTVASLVGRELSNPVAGTQIQRERDHQRPRIVERLEHDCYVVSVELDGYKGIFTYESNYPDRPTEDSIHQGPVNEEFYDLEVVRNEQKEIAEANLPSESRTMLLKAAQQFINRETAIGENTEPATEVIERLDKLGYT